MKLFKYEGFKITISEEAILLKPFRRIWMRDRSESKNKALMELGFIYFFCDPRSDYMFISDEEDRKNEIKVGEGLPPKWEPDKIVLEAVEFYKQFQPSSFLLLQDIRVAVDRVRNELRTIDMKEEVDGKRVNTVASVTKASRDALVLVKELDATEREIYKEMQESGRMRGQGEKTIMEDEIDI